MDAENTFMEGLNRLGGGDHSKDGQIKSLRLTPDIINAEDVDAALKWIGGVASTIESGIHEIAKFTGGLIRVGAFRSVVTTLDNRSPYALRLSNKSLDHGIWTKDREPPVYIPAYSIAVWSAESEGFATGTEGSVEYEISGDDRFPSYAGVASDTPIDFKIHWSNPAGGSNWVTKHWSDKPENDVAWNALHLKEPSDVHGNQAHHHWIFSTDSLSA
ncbi:hypothetical protein [Hydrocarboniphaga sp.]|uniref:hypothetical protein n=1 Tax=Hydrocarboniphaga sp. TaxID=2033016 RepID=UPI002ABB427F|nr:hypothetical protein [Hydrocarboniphaga sp.]MDZ4077328.1 hypothetical protein [Hydrocarboniphaga sp.]